MLMFWLICFLQATPTKKQRSSSVKTPMPSKVSQETRAKTTKIVPPIVHGSRLDECDYEALMIAAHNAIVNNDVKELERCIEVFIMFSYAKMM